jgi:energy-coupling factor transporter ATP-binding protein EcfA2
VRLISAHVRGYRRLVDTSVNLDSKVIALVGPNEAGKTTFLKALTFLDGDEQLDPVDRSRAVQVDDETPVVEVKFALDDDDRVAAGNLDLEEAPRTMFAVRLAGGGAVRLAIQPEPRKAVGALRACVRALEKCVARKTLMKWVVGDSPFMDPELDPARDFRSELTQLADDLGRIVLGSERLDEEALALSAAELEKSLVDDAKAGDLRDALRKTQAWLRREDPKEALSTTLWARSPEFLLFDDDDRTLRSEYALDDSLLARVPAALGNLARMAGLDLRTLTRELGDITRRETAINRANLALSSVFKKAWNQSPLSVMFSVDGGLLRVSMIENGVNVTVFDERSAGLRMFVALIAFLSTRNHVIPPILLIDEAENHLHIDAQADLVNMFVSQEQAARVIYTTHSPACLPPDLGVGVRPVTPVAGDEPRSEIRNSFWTDGAGYSPLMIAMGAAAAAFTPARFVVLGEGASEMILLPSLLRRATNLAVLPYQVAAGLSEVPRDLYCALDLEAARVAYLVDRDDGGKSLVSRLVKAGVPAERIAMLPAPGLENLLRAEDYATTVSELLAECNEGIRIPPLPALRDQVRVSWASQLEKWASTRGLEMPGKVAVATRVVETGRAVPAGSLVSALQGLHEKLIDILGVEESRVAQ